MFKVRKAFGTSSGSVIQSRNGGIMMSYNSVFMAVSVQTKLCTVFWRS